MSRLRRPVAVFLVSWPLLFWFSLLLFGAWRPLYLMASGAVSLMAAIALTVTVRFAPLGYVVRLAWLRPAVDVPLRIVVDFWTLTRELARSLATGDVTEGAFRAKPYDAGRPSGPVSGGRRALVGILAGYSPNAYVVEIDPERQQVLVHDLVPDERSEAPA